MYVQFTFHLLGVVYVLCSQHKTAFKSGGNSVYWETSQKTKEKG